MDEVFVVTGKNGFTGVALSDNGDFDIPTRHIPDTILESEYVWLSEDIELGLEVESSFGRLWVLETDKGELTSVPNIGIS